MNGGFLVANLALMDIPYLVSSQNGSVNGVTLVGVLLGEVEIPSVFAKVGVRDRIDHYALLDLVGILTKSGMYFTQGKVLTVVNQSVLDSAAKASGRLVTALTGGTLRVSNAGEVKNFVSFARWSKGHTGAWQVSRVEAGSFRRDAFPDFMDVITSSVDGNFTFPVPTPSGYTVACEGFDFKLLGGKPVPVPGKTVTSTLHGTQTPAPVTPPVAPMAFGTKIDSLGVSNSQGLEDLKRNQTLSQQFSTPGARATNRDALAPESPNIPQVKAALDHASSVVTSLIAKLDKAESDTEQFSDLIKFTATRLASSWSRRAGGYTGKQLFKEALEDVLEEFTSAQISSTLDIMNIELLDMWSKSADGHEDNKLLMQVYMLRTKIYLRIIEKLLGIRGDLISALDAAQAENVNLLSLLTSNPYNISLVYPSFSIEDLDKLAMLYQIDLNSDLVVRSRNIAYLHHVMLDNTNSIVGDNTILLYSTLISKLTVGLVLSKRSYDFLQSFGTILKPDTIDDLIFYLRSSVTASNFSLPKEGWKAQGKKYVIASKSDVQSVVADYLNSGLGISLTFGGKRYIADYIYASKELYVYNRLRDLCQAEATDVTDEQLTQCIANFEALKTKEFGFDFKLEDRQAQAVRLVSQRVMCMTGPAGSGKTTTAEALVYAITTLLGVDEEGVFFCTPTNRAANRLKEVVKRRTRTINSLFGIGGGSLRLRDPDDIKKKTDIKVLIMDESSMPTLLLLYEMLLRVEDNTRIYFLGDIEQLAPIGPGKPFANMLTFLPTVVLNVTKRASEHSGITANAKKIIYESEGVLANLEDREDFRILHETDKDRAVAKILEVCGYHLGQEANGSFRPLSSDQLTTSMSPDDIQVISPLNKDSWGTVNLNRHLQNIFNPRKTGDQSVVFSRGPEDSIEFRIGDRVVHIRSNQPDRTRLRQLDTNSFVMDETKGIYNAEQGKVVGFFKAKDLDFSHDSKENEHTLADQFRGNEDVMFLGVRFRDLDEATGDTISFIILYRMEVINFGGMQINVISHDLRDLDLAYALTVHKLQGSEAKLVVVVILPIWGDFISRNLIYTAITRGKQGCYLIGDVVGNTSAVNKGRRVEQVSRRVSIPDLI